jgi:hypothetical protein
MTIALPLLFFIFSLFFGALIARPILLRFRSAALIVATAWFAGQYVSAFCTYYLSVALVSIGQSEVLLKSCLIFPIVVTSLSVLFFRGYVTRGLQAVFTQAHKGYARGDMIACAAGFAFSFFFFLSHLRLDGNLIKISLVYWDFSIHLPVIQGFALGDNFPAENNSLSGVPLTYHFFFDFLVSMYAALGLDVVLGMNAVTIISFGFLLMTAYGLTLEFMWSRTAGCIAMALVPTSGSLRFVLDLVDIWTGTLHQRLSRLTDHPYYAAIPPHAIAGHNGNMFNIFYFLVERQMIFASIFLLISVAILHYRRSFSIGLLLVVGVAAGAFIHWHLFVTISVAMMLGGTALLGSHRVATATILLTMLLVTGYQALEMRHLTQSDLFFFEIRDYPQFNPQFPTMNPSGSRTGYPLTIRNFLWYYLFAYGVKVVFIPLGLVWLWKRQRQLAIIFLALIVPTFIAINTVQLSPLSVYDNHKWLRPLNVVLDILVAWAIATFFLNKKTLARRSVGICAITLCTASGIIDLLPYLAPVKGTDREKVYAHRHTPLTDALEAFTPRQSNFLASSALEVHLAGRRTFLSNSYDEPGAVGMATSFRINEGPRQIIRAQIYNATSAQELCQIAKSHHIDYVEQSDASPSIRARPEHSEWPFVSGKDRRGREISFLDVASLCDKVRLSEAPSVNTKEEVAQLSANERKSAIALSSIAPISTQAGFAPPKTNKSFQGSPLQLAGKIYESGLGLHAPTVLTYAVPSDSTLLSGIVGLDDVVSCKGHSVVFRILDESGRTLFDSGLLVVPSEPRAFAVDVTSTKKITLSVSDSGDGIACDHVDLADLFFSRAKQS